MSDYEKDSQADRAFAADVAAPTFVVELAKRARPDTSLSDEQEDKRVKLSHACALLPPTESAYTSRSQSPARSLSLAEMLPMPPNTITTSSPPLEAPLASAHPEPPRSPSALSTAHSESASWPKDSTSYAGLASPTGRPVPMDVLQPTSPLPSTSYATAAAAPRNSPAPATTTTAEPQPSPRTSYPPLVVDCLPNWTRHFEALRRELGHAPNARPLGRGVRFLPKSAEEFRTVQRYLILAANQDATISWFCYSPETERPTKVAIRGLPMDTAPDEVIAALRSLGFPAENARSIPPPPKKHGCTYFVQLAHLTQEELRELFAVAELLHMPGVTVEAWRGGRRPPQCHRCQIFGHASTNCHRPQRCVRCAGEHPTRDCQRSRDDAPTCANCGESHAANDKRCVHFKREARRRGIILPPPPPRAPQRHQLQQQWREAAALHPTAPPLHTTTDNALSTHAQRANPTRTDEVRSEVRGSTTLAAQANPPTERGQPLRRKKKKRNRPPRPLRTEPAAASTPQPRQTREEAAPNRPPPQEVTSRPSAQEPAEALAQILAQALLPATTQAPVPSAISQARAPTQMQRPIQGSDQPSATRPVQRLTQRPTQASTFAPPSAHQGQGEDRNNPDFMAIVRVVMEALMAGLTAYLQGQNIMSALAAGMAVLTRLQSC